MILFLLKGLCLTWVLFTILFQFENKVSDFISKLDIFCLIPKWTFFAPNPGNIDIYLLSRFTINGEIGQWENITITSYSKENFRRLRSVFNPHRRIDKMLFDFVNEVRTLKDDQAAIRHLTNYISILKIVELMANEKNASNVQFMLIGDNTTIMKDIEVIFISDTHVVA